MISKLQGGGIGQGLGHIYSHDHSAASAVHRTSSALVEENSVTNTKFSNLLFVLLGAYISAPGLYAKWRTLVRCQHTWSMSNCGFS